MIKRLNQIKNIGAFRDFSNGGSVQFEKLTFIYGLNTRGKTTLTDIFSSLQDNNSTLITERESIPEVSSGQSVKMSVKPEETGTEDSCSYINGNWTNTSFSENLQIFGSEFIHKNLFTGLEVERKNKENLTQFILGQEGVELANLIAGDKRLLRQKKGLVSGLVPSHVQNKSSEEIEAFLELDLNGIDLESAQQELSTLLERFKEEKQRLDKPTEILAIQDFPEFIVPENTVDELLAKTIILYGREYSEISADALEHIQSHIAQNFEVEETAENWIKEGLDTKSDASDNCGFCGQPLRNASDLIEAYHSYFNEAYRAYISEISNEIAQLTVEWQRTSLNSIGRVVARQSLLTRYQQLISSSNFDKLVSDFNRLADIQIEQNLNEKINDLSRLVAESFQAKERKPHESITSPDFSELNQFCSTYFEKTAELEGVLNNVTQAIQEFKDSYRDQSEIRLRIEQINTSIEFLKTQIARVDQNEQCIAYSQALQEIVTIRERITTNEEMLSINQSQYLEEFYDKLDYHFQRFGSENFTLERETSNRGDQPVYFLKVKYRNVEIDESNFTKVFSESDKRALALSVFWSKIDLLEVDQKNNAIVILDDPITSFDDNRIALSLSIIKETLRSVRQIIILTHYSHFIRIFCEKSMNDDFTTAFIEIDQNITTSLLKITRKELFIETTYEKKFKKIQSFINRETNEDIRQDLRPFLESQYIPHFYISKLREAKSNGVPCGTLNEKIEAIFDGNEDVKRKFHEYRAALNADSHIFTSDNEENVRGFAREMMTYLYNFDYI